VTGTQVQPQQSPGANTAPAQARAIQQRIADELGVRPGQVAAAVDLLDGGATVPFVARYRKEATGSLDDAQLRTLEERLRYLRELEERRAVVLDSIRSQGKLDDALEARILAADSKARLEDIYLPYKPKRRTKAMIARENGLEPLADALLADPTLDPTATAAGYVTENVPDGAAALEGARAILVERFSEDADLIGGLRERMWNRGRLVSTVRAGKETEGAKFADYFDFSEPFTKLPSHRILAVFRGEKEDVLDVTLDPGDGSTPRSRSPTTSARSPPRRAFATRAARRTSGSPRWCAGPGAPGSCSGCRSTCGCGCGRSRRRPRSPSSPRTCATCCSPPRPAPAPRWAWILACAPASRSRSSTPRERSSRRTRSTRTSRAATGTARSRP
jgi:hypothetical protein